MESTLHEPLARFVVQAIAIVGLSRLFGAAARRVRQPSTVAEIAAGIALGPSLLGALSPDASKFLFPQEPESLLHPISQVGLLLFLFLVGLELDIKRFGAKSGPSEFWLHTGALVPLAAGALIALPLYGPFAPPGVSLWIFALFMGAAATITAFPVLARILVERRLLRTDVGKLAITSAAVDDVVAWCLLVLVVAVARAETPSLAAQSILWAFVYVASMLVIVRPLLRRLGERTGVTALSQHVVAALLIGALFSSWVTSAIGIHPVFGAFAFGVVVPKEGGLARALAARLEDLVVILFLPLFFLSSGLRTQLGLLREPNALAACGLIIFITTLGKLGRGALTGRFSGLSWRDSMGLGTLLNTKGLIEICVLNIGFEVGLITPTLFAMLVVMTLVSTALTSPVIAWLCPGAPSPSTKNSDHPPVTQKVGGGFTVLACIAFERSGPAMATLSAALLGDDARNRFYALRLVPPVERASFVIDQHHAPDDVDALKPLVERASELKLTVHPLSFVSTHPADDICSVAGVKRASLILLGWNKPLIGNAALGGTVHEVMQNAKTDVGVLLDRGLLRLERVLVPYLGSAHDRAALAVARRIVHHTGAEATVLHVITSGREGKLHVGRKVEEVFQEKTLGLSAQVVFKTVEHASPVTAVLEESENEYDLVVIGVGPEWGLESRLFGMQAEVILAQCSTSILVMRGKK